MGLSRVNEAIHEFNEGPSDITQYFWENKDRAWLTQIVTE
jgi:hypothetical protein